jgi:hypothetical protein
VAVVQQAIQDRGCHHRIPEHRVMPQTLTGESLTSRSLIHFTLSMGTTLRSFVAGQGAARTWLSLG